ncbi:outer membrane protein assembly factor BamC [Mycoavidus sp. B2-EB]|uniref:outer membrane protein assembly factor BamC n=1 Tax=Mycoavidus sp. B2-EB TaxID=2651972 RepID=UPI0016258499|nr:outer membrane protein assembly factor BamC [Mycoavidus sp. B2-EB]BBO60027.1 lipoprotein [Mycoavidus sp. B2-EB]
MIQSTVILRTVACSICVLALASCSTPNPSAIDYQGAAKTKITPLVLPPDMAQTVAHQRGPASNGTVTLSSYLRPERVAMPFELALEPLVGMQIERKGRLRRLLVEQQTPQQLWPQIRQFWQAQGFAITLDSPEQGVMETDWKETYAKIDQGMIRNTLAKVLPGAYVTGERNRYRLRLEPRAQGGAHILLNQQGMHEVLIGRNKETSEWQNTPNDPVLEAEYLQRLMYALGPHKASQTQAVAAQDPSASAAQLNAASPVSGSQIDFAEPFERVWLYIGYALERSNFTLETGNRAQGIYTVRYVDPAALNAPQPGFWRQVFHGKKEQVAKQYKLRVQAMTQTTTHVAVVNEAGEIDASPSAQRILALLADQLH